MLTVSYVYVLALFLLCCLFRWRQRPKKFPPGPLGIPILGITPFVGSRMEKYLASYYAKYGGVMSFRLATKDWIILNDIEAITQAYSKQGESFSGRPQSYLFDKLTEGCGIAFANGPRWQEQRRFVLTALKTLGMGKKGMEEIIKTENQHFISVIQNSGGKVHILKEIRRLEANIISKVLIGKRFDYTDERLNSIIDCRPTSSVVLSLPFLRFIPPFRESYKKLVSNTQHVISK
uniref:cytochrome P450 2F5-like isoform X1 n=1 Tax=Ciona intestinalis TaxID=7719 RepID=UPI000EF50B5A|nr:cytochrome P450 2F5-like isoform X1 [Ciona intestinalis]|eukprot:XP_026690104.1 cytochrome P450 2F5-like isoform X1 [Ciona intestinalis]